MPIRVLLVDDVVEVRRLVRTSLRFRGGFEVVGEAADGAEAVRLAARAAPRRRRAGPRPARHRRAGGPHPRPRDVAAASKVVVFSGLETVDRAWIDANAARLRAQGRRPRLPRRPARVRRAATSEQRGGHRPAARPEQRERRPPVREARSCASGASSSRSTTRSSWSASWPPTRSPTRTRRTGSGWPRPRHALRIEVDDDGAGTPEPQPLTDDEEHGRGLHLVGALAASWGMDVAESGGKRVWAELPIAGAGCRVGRAPADP